MSRKTTLSVFKISFILVLFLHTWQASAMTLMEAYEAALANDSVYRSAQHENEAGQQYKEIGRANLLPNISASYAYSRNNSEIEISGAGPTRSENRNYNSKNAIIQLRQPIINMEGWARFHQGNAQSNLSAMKFEGQRQELISRFFVLFSSANYAKDVVAFSEVEKDSIKKQEEANKLMSQRGEGTKTALIESQAKLSLTEAQLIEAQQSLADAQSALAVMIGKEVTILDRLVDTFEVLPIESEDFSTWTNIALKNNPEILTQQQGVEIAKQEVKRNRAGHMPRLDVLASVSKTESDTTSTFNQDINTNSIGLQLNIPLYSGGSVDASTLQAEANYKKAQDDLESKTNEVLLELRKQHTALKTGLLKIEALKQSVASSDLLVAATKKSLVGGVRTNLDVLDARSQLYGAKRDLALAKYNYMVSYLNLKKSAGVLSVADLEKLSTYFVSEAGGTSSYQRSE